MWEFIIVTLIAGSLFDGLDRASRATWRRSSSRRPHRGGGGGWWDGNGSSGA
jgi:hypothetical protein